MIVLGTKSETSHGAILPGLSQLVVGNEIAHGKVLTLDPKSTSLRNGGINDDAGISDAGGYRGIVLLPDGSASGTMFTVKEVLEGLLRMNIRWDEIIHVDLIKIHKGSNLLCGFAGPFLLPCSLTRSVSA